MALSFTEENYIKAIYSLSLHSKKGVTTTMLSRQLDTKPASITDMLQKLSEKKLIEYKKYYGASLTAKGNKVALEVIRKHRLWEAFLVSKLDFNWDEVHEIAEQLEHIQSEKLTNKLDAFLGFPAFDPHGDPIPDADGNFPKRKREALENCEKGDVVTICAVRDSSSELLRYLDRIGIELNCDYTVVEKEEYDSTMLLIDGEEKRYFLGEKAVKNLWILKD